MTEAEAAVIAPPGLERTHSGNFKFNPCALEYKPSSSPADPSWSPLPTSVDGGDGTYQYMYNSLFYQYNTEVSFLRHQVVELTHRLAELDRLKMQTMGLVRDLRDQHRALRRKIGDNSPAPPEQKVAEALLSKTRAAPASASPPPPSGTPDPMPGSTPGRMLGPFNSACRFLSFAAKRMLPVEETGGTRFSGEILEKNEVFWGKHFVCEFGEEYVQLADDAGQLADDKWVTIRKWCKKGNKEMKLTRLAIELTKQILTLHFDVDLTTVTATSMGGNELAVVPVSPDITVSALHKVMSDVMKCNPKALATVLTDGRELVNPDAILADALV